MRNTNVKEMDASEKLAKKLLQSLGFSDIEFEPDGNVPPDFLVDQKIAIEVRRLNQNYVIDGKPKGLEETEIPLRQKIGNELKRFDIGYSANSYFVSYDYYRPIPPWKDIKSGVQNILHEFIIGNINENESYEIAPRFFVELIQASKCHSNTFLLGGYCDFDMGGFVLSEVHRNIELCIEEKTSKITKYREKYGEWWLVLIDRIGHSLSVEDRNEFSKEFQVVHDWDKVILVNPLNHEEYFII